MELPWPTQPGLRAPAPTGAQIVSQGTLGSQAGFIETPKPGPGGESCAGNLYALSTQGWPVKEKVTHGRVIM